MQTTTKREIAERVAQQTGLPQVAVKQVVQMLFEEITSELANGNRLEFRDFGVFEVVLRKARTGRNPRTGEKVAVPPKRVVTFKMGKVMKTRVAATAPGAPAGFPAAAARPEPQPEPNPWRPPQQV